MWSFELVLKDRSFRLSFVRHPSYLRGIVPLLKLSLSTSGFFYLLPSLGKFPFKLLIIKMLFQLPEFSRIALPKIINSSLCSSNGEGGVCERLAVAVALGSNCNYKL